jgi:hypothetical protein
MTAIVRIDDEVIDTDYFIRTLKLTGQFEGLIEQLVREKLTVRAAKKQGWDCPCRPRKSRSAPTSSAASRGCTGQPT